VKKTVAVFIAGAIVGAALTLAWPRKAAAPAPAAGKEHVDDHGDEHSEDEVHLSGPAREGAGIRTIEVLRRRYGSVLSSTAVIRSNADRLAHVSPRVAGRVVAIKALQGSPVKQGDPLLVIDSIEMGSAAADFLKARAALDVARVGFEMEEDLVKKNATRATDYNEAKGRFITAQAELQATREKLLLLGWTAERVDALRWDDPEGLSRVTIRAPVAGEVVEKHATMGEMVHLESNLFTISDPSSVWVVIDIYQRDVTRVHKDQSVQVACDAYPGRIFTGRVTYVGQIMVEETRTLEVRVEIENPEGLLKPGMYVLPTIIDDQDEHARECLAVPSAAIQRIDDVPVVFAAVEGEDGAYARIAVTLGERFGDWHEVLAGLKGGEIVVTEGSFVLKSELQRSKMGHGHAH
jgi:cobalt-zinc-cadmium efflux system membrane fusion protein